MSERDAPPHLAATVRMIRAAYPEGVPEPDRTGLIQVLYPHMSDRNLTEVLNILWGDNTGSHYNNVLAAGANRSSGPAAERVVAALRDHGFDAWRQEE